MTRSGAEAAETRALRRLAVVLVLFVAAPTAGDIGSCGQAIEELDEAKFFEAKREIDCRSCVECGLRTELCNEACSATGPAEFPEGCVPLVHDGEVCLRALEAASCSDYAEFMADSGGSVPTECNFCPPVASTRRAQDIAPAETEQAQ